MGIRSWFHAVGDLCRRYSAAFSHAWQHRAQTDTEPRLSHEMTFLPAALALQETPVSPIPRVSMWMIMGFAILAFLWAVCGKIDVVATAQGEIVPSGRVKTIQSFETATVKRIHVTDGQFVKAGDVLIELDATTSEADKDKAESDLATARLQVARAKAMLKALELGKPPRWTYSSRGMDVSRVLESKQLLLGQYEEYASKLSNIDAEIQTKEAERRSTLDLVHKLEKVVPLVRKRADDFEEMSKERLVPRHDFMEREQTLVEQEGDLANQRSRVKEIDAAIHEARSRRLALIAETRRTTLDSLNEGVQKVADLEQELLKARSHDELMTLTSPVDGTVQQLAIHTIGGVVTPAQALMVIVPKDQALEIEASIENKDIGFVKVGQSAEVKIETFQYTKYGTIHAKIFSVSHDAIKDEKRGLIYSARVKMERSTLNVDGTEVHLSPGMAVTVEIKTGKRRVIEYFLSPLLDYGHTSFQER